MRPTTRRLAAPQPRKRLYVIACICHSSFCSEFFNYLLGEFDHGAMKDFKKGYRPLLIGTIPGNDRHGEVALEQRWRTSAVGKSASLPTSFSLPHRSIGVAAGALSFIIVSRYQAARRWFDGACG
jgi:hypothetical protein